MNSGSWKELRYKAPDDLRATLAGLAEGGQKKQIIGHVKCGNWIGAALGLAAVACFVVWANFGGPPKSGDIVTHEVVGSHVRSLMGDHLFDVASTDRHTVKPWFTGKLDFSPRVVNLVEGFTMVGGRLDYIAARPVAAVVYKRDQHVINLFTWPQVVGKDQAPTFIGLQGFNIWRWTSGGMHYHAVSDLKGNALREFVEHIRREG